MLTRPRVRPGVGPVLRRAVRRGPGIVIALAVALGLPLACAAPVSADQVRQRQLWVLKALHVQTAWAITQGQGVLVAVIDSGVDRSVSDLAGSVVSGPDLTGVNTPPSNPNWGVHGTWMASLIAGHGHGRGDQSGVLGVAPRAKILSIRVITDSSDPGYARYQNELPSRGQRELATAIRYAVSRHAGVISMSLGYQAPSLVVRAALQYAVNHNVVVVASSGNSGTVQTARGHGHAPYSFPADYPGVIGVAAVRASGVPAYFSSENLSVEVAAPGVNVLAAGRGNRYWLVSGTSPACALTAGVAALVKAKYPKLSAAQVRLAITSSAAGGPSHGYNDEVGFGTVNATAALTAAGRLARLAPAGNSATAKAAQAGHFGGGPTGVPLPPVPPRGRKMIYLLGALAVACLLIVVASAWRLAVGLTGRTPAQTTTAGPAAGSAVAAGAVGPAPAAGPAAGASAGAATVGAVPAAGAVGMTTGLRHPPQGQPGASPAASGHSGYPGTRYPGPGQPGPGQPGLGYPAHSGSGYPGQGYPGSGYPGSGYPGQGEAGADYPGPGYPDSARSGSGYPGPGYPGPSRPGPGYPGPSRPGPGYPGQDDLGRDQADPGYPRPGYLGPSHAGPGYSGQQAAGPAAHAEPAPDYRVQAWPAELWPGDGRPGQAPPGQAPAGRAWPERERTGQAYPPQQGVPGQPPVDPGKPDPGDPSQGAPGLLGRPGPGFRLERGLGAGALRPGSYDRGSDQPAADPAPRSHPAAGPLDQTGPVRPLTGRIIPARPRTGASPPGLPGPEREPDRELSRDPRRDPGRDPGHGPYRDPARWPEPPGPRHEARAGQPGSGEGSDYPSGPGPAAGPAGRSRNAASAGQPDASGSSGHAGSARPVSPPVQFPATARAAGVTRPAVSPPGAATRPGSPSSTSPAASPADHGTTSPASASPFGSRPGASPSDSAGSPSADTAPQSSADARPEPASPLRPVWDAWTPRGPGDEAGVGTGE